MSIHKISWREKYHRLFIKYLAMKGELIRLKNMENHFLLVRKQMESWKQ